MLKANAPSSHFCLLEREFAYFLKSFSCLEKANNLTNRLCRKSIDILKFIFDSIPLYVKALQKTHLSNREKSSECNANVNLVI